MNDEVMLELKQAQELGEKLHKLISDTPPEIQQALDTIGVSVSLRLLAMNTDKGKEMGLARASFTLGVYIGRQQAQLEALYIGKED